MKRSLLLIGVAAALVSVGCNNEPYEIVPVSGTITFEGKPLGGASISTQPRTGAESPGPGSYAVSKEDGSFTLLRVDNDKPGAVVGSNSVTITMHGHSANPMSDELDPKEMNPLPEAYQDGSMLKDIPAEGSDSWNLDLKKRPDF